MTFIGFSNRFGVLSALISMTFKHGVHILSLSGVLFSLSLICMSIQFFYFFNMHKYSITQKKRWYFFIEFQHFHTWNNLRSFI